MTIKLGPGHHFLLGFTGDLPLPVIGLLATTGSGFLLNPLGFFLLLRLAIVRLTHLRRLKI